jgi:hypothetical protein
MPWIRLPKSGIAMHLNGPLRPGMVEIPDPDAKAPEPKKGTDKKAQEPTK